MLVKSVIQADKGQESGGGGEPSEANSEMESNQTHMNRSFIKFEYHIVYSVAYEVPVLYFTAYHPGEG